MDDLTPRPDSSSPGDFRASLPTPRDPRQHPLWQDIERLEALLDDCGPIGRLVQGVQFYDRRLRRRLVAFALTLAPQQMETFRRLVADVDSAITDSFIEDDEPAPPAA